MEITHHTYNLRIAPRKLRLVVDKIRHQNALKTIELLPLITKKGAPLLHKSLKAAVEMAKDQQLDPESLVIQRVWCDEGPALKRAIGHSRGRMSPIMKKYSHLSLVLAGNTAIKSKRKTTATTNAAAAEQEVEEEK